MEINSSPSRVSDQPVPQPTLTANKKHSGPGIIDPDCYHHDPSRALANLTEIEKHFFPELGEKMLMCERCLKMYTLRSDWKAHVKSCGTKCHLCDCGICLSCAAAATRSQSRTFWDFEAATATSIPPPTYSLMSPGLSGQTSAEPHIIDFASGLNQSTCTELPQLPSSYTGSLKCSKDGPGQSGKIYPMSLQYNQSTCTELPQLPSSYTDSLTSSMDAPGQSGEIYPMSLQYNQSTCTELPQLPSSYTGSLTCSMDGPGQSGEEIDPMSLQYGSPSPFILPAHYAPIPLQAQYSATALLQHVAQMGCRTSNPYFFHDLLLPVVPSPLDLHQDNVLTMASATTSSHGLWLQKEMMASGLGMGRGVEAASSGFSTLFGGSSGDPSELVDKPTTLDLLGLGMGGGVDAASSGLLDVFKSMGGGST